MHTPVKPGVTVRGAVSLPLAPPFSVGRTLAFLRSSSLRTPYRFIGPRRRRLMAALGDRALIDGIAYLGYPSPRRLMAAAPRALRSLGLSRQKARYVLEVAARAAAGALTPGAFTHLTDEEAIARLTDIPGVGRWTAEIVLMRGLGRPDIFPAGDLGLQTAVQRLLGRAARPREDELPALRDEWQGGRSYGALYLWRSLGITA